MKYIDASYDNDGSVWAQGVIPENDFEEYIVQQELEKYMGLRSCALLRNGKVCPVFLLINEDCPTFSPKGWIRGTLLIDEINQFDSGRDIPRGTLPLERSDFFGKDEYVEIRLRLLRKWDNRPHLQWSVIPRKSKWIKSSSPREMGIDNLDGLYLKEPEIE